MPINIEGRYSGPHSAFQVNDPILSWCKKFHQQLKQAVESESTYRLPMFPKPFTMPMAADRFAGGRGIALATHTIVSAKPTHKP